MAIKPKNKRALVSGIILSAFLLSLITVRPLRSEDAHSAQSPDPIDTIVIDPGHGGRDPGAVGPGGVYEKDVVLQVSLKAREKLAEKGYKVVLTREKDEFLGLQERAAIANEAGGDIFISVHANASPHGGWGFETYFLSATASDDEARKTAHKENKAVKFELGGHDLPPEINSDLEAILFDMAQSEYLRESEKLALILQDRLDSLLESPNRGIKQAPFLVLMGATMPAVLVEIGFVSNEKELKRLTDSEMQNRIAGALTESIHKFVERRTARLGYPKPPKIVQSGG